MKKTKRNKLRFCEAIVGVGAIVGACAASVAALTAHRKNKDIEFDDVFFDYDDIDEAGLLLNCELGLACNSDVRRCPGCIQATADGCAYGFAVEECVLPVSEGNADDLEEEAPDQTENAEIGMEGQ